MLTKDGLKIVKISLIGGIIMVNLSHIGKCIEFIFDDSQNFAPKDRNGTKPTASAPNLLTLITYFNYVPLNGCD